MELKMFAVKDRAADAFNRPFFFPTVGMAHRSFVDEVNRADANNPMYAHPEDYDLYHIGAFDEESGALVPLERPVVVVRAQDVKKEVN